jgi:hypothetical protein
MDLAGEELGRIVAYVNRRPWIMEDPSDCFRGLGSAQEASGKEVNEEALPVNSNYFLDRIGKTDSGDTSLHRLCAWHATPDQFQNFLSHMEAHSDFTLDCQMLSSQTECSCTPSSHERHHRYAGMPPPPLLNQTNHKGVTALHVAVYRNSFYAYPIVQQLLAHDKSLASIPMSCGSYPLHILCAHNVTIRRELLSLLLDADPSVVWKEDVNGDTPLSLLWKNILRFRWAQQEKIELDEDEPGICSWLTVISPDQFLEFSLMLIQAALGKKTLRLVDVCRMPRCPPLLIDLILRKYDKSPTSIVVMEPNLLATDEDHMTPLHYVALVHHVTDKFVPLNVKIRMRSALDLVLDESPLMASVRDRWGRIPLHYALEKSGHDVDVEALFRLVAANPDSFGIKDPVSGLYPFALLAASTESEGPQEEVSTKMHTSHLGSVFNVLRCFPEAAIYRG